MKECKHGSHEKPENRLPCKILGPRLIMYDNAERGFHGSDVWERARSP